LRHRLPELLLGEASPLIPFRSYRERALWAAGHTARTGHDEWFCMDGYPSMADAQQEIEIADTVEKWIGERS
jgi:hypothetical protein